MKTCRQLTYEQRCQIYALKKSGITHQEIAAPIGASQSARLAVSSSARGYRYKQAQGMSGERRAEAAKAIKMTPDMILSY